MDGWRDHFLAYLLQRLRNNKSVSLALFVPKAAHYAWQAGSVPIVNK